MAWFSNTFFFTFYSRKESYKTQFDTFHIVVRRVWKYNVLRTTNEYLLEMKQDCLYPNSRLGYAPLNVSDGRTDYVRP